MKRSSSLSSSSSSSSTTASSSSSSTMTRQNVIIIFLVIIISFLMTERLIIYDEDHDHYLKGLVDKARDKLHYRSSSSSSLSSTTITNTIPLRPYNKENNRLFNKSSNSNDINNIIINNNNNNNNNNRISNNGKNNIDTIDSSSSSSLQNFKQNELKNITLTDEQKVMRRRSRKKKVADHEHYNIDNPNSIVSMTNNIESVIANYTISLETGETKRIRIGNPNSLNNVVSSNNNYNRNKIKSISHTDFSPREGTDISPESQMAVLRCVNQSQCVVPSLQLIPKVKIYFCRHPVRHGVRFYFLVREGLLLHPNVQLLEYNQIKEADYIIYLPGSAPWHLTECSNMSFVPKLIVLDEFDGANEFRPRETLAEMVRDYGKDMIWYFMYFKRSFVARSDGKFLNHPHLDKHHFYPMTYAIAEAYTQHIFTFQRQIEIVCTLRGSKQMSTRQRVQDWISEYVKVKDIKNAITGEINRASRVSVSKKYFEQMFNAQIIVTVNPANWEGDFRLWESMATGALVMVDPIFVPHNYPLLDGVHIVYFSNKNKTELWEKLDYYRKNKEEARKIAINGYLYCMKYHRTVNLVDYVLRSAHVKSAIDNNLPIPKYKYTAQYLNHETREQRHVITKVQKPGLYHHKDDHHSFHTSS